MKKIKSFLKCFALTGPLLFLNCEIESFDEGSLHINTINALELFEASFDLDTFDDPSQTLRDKIAVQWNQYQIVEKDGTKWYEFAIEEQGITEVVSSEITHINYSLVAAFSEDNVPTYYLVEMASHNGQPHFSYFGLEEAFYTGMVYFYDMKGKPNMLAYYEKGAVQSTVLEENLNTFQLNSLAAYCTQKNALTSRCEGTNCPPSTTPTGCGGSGQGSWVWEYVGWIKDWYFDRNGDGRGQVGEYAYTETGGSYQYVWVSGSGGSGGTSSTYETQEYYLETTNGNVRLASNPAGLTNLNNIIFDITVDYKVLCVYNKLQKMSESFRDVVKKFDGDFPVNHLRFEMRDLPNDVHAVTDNSANNFIAIGFNENTISERPILSLANTFAHEIIHAEMYRKLKSVGYNISIDNFPGIYDYYRRYVKNWQHEQMAAHYRQWIIDVMKEFDSNMNSNEVYNAFSWVGLTGTSEWNKLTQNEKLEIINTVLDFEDNANTSCE